MNNHKDQTELMGKYLAGEATPSEALQLEKWLEEKPELQKEYDDLAKIWGGAVSQPPPEKDAQWNQLQGKISSGRVHQNRTQLLRHLAAACLLGVVLTAAFFASQRKDFATTDKPGSISTITRQTTDSVREETLTDGSAIVLNKNSAITFAADFNQHKRNLTATGEAYFNVAHNKQKPFSIQMDGLQIKVIGTSFNVKEHMQPKRIEVQVQSGLVEMQSSQGTLRVAKGQTGWYNKETRGLQLMDSIDINDFSYATKSFRFTDITLEKATNYLEKAFDVTINFSNSSLSDCRITAQFSEKSLHYILDIIGATLNISYQQKDKTIYINGPGCK